MSHSSSEQSLLLLHDGELADVAALLRELGGSATERRGSAAPADAEHSWRLLVSSARRALELPAALLRASNTRIAILDGEARTVCALLRRSGFGVIVRRPVHPAALRLLLLHALYRGPEKRRTPRVSVGAPVHVRAGLRRSRAILAEISERGCRLLSGQRVSLGQTLTLQIPAALAGARAFSLKGMVVRASPAQIGAPGVITLEFDPLRGAQRERVRALVSAHSGGPSALARGEWLADTDAAALAPPALEPRAPDGPSPSSAALACSTPAAAEPVPAEPLASPAEPDAREAAAEAEIEIDLEEEPPAPPRRLVPLCDEAARVVLARGLSREGMRADPGLRLAPNAQISLALHVDAGGPPLRVRARVEAGAEGAARGVDAPGPWLRFRDLAPADGERLDALLAGLSIFAGGDGPEHALVVCEILDPARG